MLTTGDIILIIFIIIGILIMIAGFYLDRCEGVVWYNQPNKFSFRELQTIYTANSDALNLTNHLGIIRYNKTDTIYCYFQVSLISYLWFLPRFYSTKRRNEKIKNTISHDKALREILEDCQDHIDELKRQAEAQIEEAKVLNDTVTKNLNEKSC